MAGKYKQVVSIMKEKRKSVILDENFDDNHGSNSEQILADTELENAENMGNAENSQQPDLKDAQLAEMQEKLLRLHADFDNFRKRTNKEKEEWYQYASQSVMEKLLPVIDNLERALGSLNQQSEEVQSLFSGITLTYRQFLEILQKEGLEAIDAVGQDFDPVYHEAMMRAPVEPGQRDNQIVEELRRGYLFKDKVIRAALVKVAKK
jgi:molecular chaperone GrpE